ncbi:MAG: OmpA family protein [Hyphomicrobiales bacterium]|jgi:outer membrane protein OmpA-like peptidoglycan-associated protein
MKSHTTRTKIFRSSTAIALAMAMTSPSNLALAQTAENVVDCLVDTANPACLEAPASAENAAPVEPEAAPVEAETEANVAPEADTPAESQAEATVEEAPAEAPVPVDQPTDAQASEPAIEVETAPVEESETQEAEQVQPTAEVEAETAEPAPAEEAPIESLAAEEPTPIEEPAPGETPATEETAEETPLVIPADNATPEEATADTSEDQPSDTQAAAPPAPVQEPEAATTVIADETTEDQAAQLSAQEEQRREDARERRNELLGAAAVGAIVGAIIPALGGRVVEDQGDRLIIERDGEYFVRRDESSLLRDGDAEMRVERLRGGLTQETITRRNGVQIITIRDEGGFVLYRSRIRRDGREVVLIDNRGFNDPNDIFVNDLPPLQLQIPQERYIVPAQRASYDVIFDTFAAPPVMQVEQTYTLRQVRENERVRDLVRRVDLDSITFETGQATVRQSQVPLLEDIARAALALIDRDPTSLLLVEGHTDAVGSEVSNLALSDRRAETVASILVAYFDVPPENLIVQGYGESFLKVPTQAAEEQNRRVTIRNITPLLGSAK